MLKHVSNYIKKIECVIALKYTSAKYGLRTILILIGQCSSVVRVAVWKLKGHQFNSRFPHDCIEVPLIVPDG